MIDGRTVYSYLDGLGGVGGWLLCGLGEELYLKRREGEGETARWAVKLCPPTARSPTEGIGSS